MSFLQTTLLPALKNLSDQARRYGPLVSTNDLIKALAVVIMVIDHTGYFFFPDDPMWRAVGRIGFPVWFFMAGYAKPGRNGLWLPLGAAFLVAVDVACQRPVFPLNALVTIMLIRWLVQYVQPARLLSDILFIVALVAAAVSAFMFSSLLFEYGSLGLLFGVLGRVVREAPDNAARRLFAGLCFATFLFLQQLSGEFAPAPYLVMAVGTAGTMLWLYHFKSFSFTGSASWGGLSPLIRFLGRHTLGIYVWHIALFTWLWVLINPTVLKGFRWF